MQTNVNAPAPPQPLAMDQLIDMYTKLRAKRDTIKARHKQELEKVNEVMERIETIIQSSLVAGGVNSVRTDAGTAFQTTRNSITVADPAAFRQWAIATGNQGLYENRVSKEAVEEYMKQGHPLPPGLKMSSDTTVNIRK